MEIDKIKNNVNNAVDEFVSEFQNQPTLFYTEGDIVCRLYDMLQKNLAYKKTEDRDGCLHYVLHREYPTPFRCSMSGSKFEIKSDYNRTNGKKYRRGHYDIVLLNPKFIRESEYNNIRGQDYKHIKYDNIAPDPVIIYGIEVLLNRKTLTSKGIDDFVAKVEQDYKKLRDSKTLKKNGSIKNEIKFMENILLLVFNSYKECHERLKENLKERLGESTELRCIP